MFLEFNCEINSGERIEELPRPMMRSNPAIMEWLDPRIQQRPFLIQCADLVMILQVREAFLAGG
jgi:hypothetical protein